jgi:hypothetical protein
VRNSEKRIAASSTDAKVNVTGAKPTSKADSPGASTTRFGESVPFAIYAFWMN